MMKSNDYTLKLVLVVPLLYMMASMYFYSALSRHENDSLLYSPASLRSHSSNTLTFPTIKPRVFGYYFEAIERSSLAARPPSKLPVHWENALYELYPSKRIVLWERRERVAQNELMNSKSYDKPNHNPLTPYEEHKECIPMHNWQTSAFPTCNSVHEADISHFFHKHRKKYVDLVKLLAHGYFRDVYRITDADTFTSIALKTNRFERTFDRWTLDRHRMDALAMDRMTTSHNIMNIYAYCGVGSLVEYADGGDLNDRINEESSESSDEDSEEKYLRRLHYALDIANAMCDLHQIDGRDGIYSSIVHADIYPTQMIFSQGKLKLNDFNRCHFMYWNTTNNKESCPYIYMDYNAGPFRSPEELKYSLQTEKIDVYSMGNIFYILLTEQYPFEVDEEKKGEKFVQQLVKKGTKPHLSGEILQSSDPSIQTLIHAMELCHTYDWKLRPHSFEIRDYLRNSLHAATGQK